MRWVAFVLVLFVTALAAAPRSDASPERRGCCSHHHGVCGCSGGRDVCCDNTFSPTCRC
ncbi:MAG TPA: hypothetical protein VGH28_29940 [Polyangiaceae bacterium]